MLLLYQHLCDAVSALQAVLPCAEYYKRQGFPLKKIVKYAANRDYSDLLVFNEDRKEVGWVFGVGGGRQGRCNRTVGQERVKGLAGSAAGWAGLARPGGDMDASPEEGSEVCCQQGPQ